MSWLAGLTSRGLSEDCAELTIVSYYGPFVIVTTTTNHHRHQLFLVLIDDLGEWKRIEGRITHAGLLAHLIFLLMGVRGAGVEGGVIVAGRGVVGAGFAVFGRFGVDAVFVLGVLSGVG